MTAQLSLPTLYNGTWFRSRLEAHWAHFFKFLNIDFYYEDNSWPVGPNLWYVPDFYLPTVYFLEYSSPGLWLEVKGAMTETAKRKAIGLVNFAEAPVVMAIGNFFKDGGQMISYSPYATCDDELRKWRKNQDPIGIVSKTYIAYCLGCKRVFITSQDRLKKGCNFCGMGIYPIHPLEKPTHAVFAAIRKTSGRLHNAVFPEHEPISLNGGDA